MADKSRQNTTMKNEQGLCSFEGCENGGKLTRTWCSTHYHRWRIWGDVNIVRDVWRSLGNSPEERFWARVTITMDSTKCWVWTGRKNQYGYGIIRDKKRRNQLAHRVAWKLVHGKHPTLLVLHSCDNPPCVNPNHLWEGTHADNTADKIAKNRQAKGNQFSDTKLTPSIVLMIRNQYKSGISQTTLAHKLGVGATTIHNAITRKTWKHI